MGHRYRGLPPEAPGWSRVIFAVLGVLLALVGAVTFGLPRLAGCRCEGKLELGAIGNLRVIQTGQSIYQEKFAGGAGDLARLRDANLLGEQLGQGLKEGYRFTVVSGRSTTHWRGAIWWAAADPIVEGDPHARHFFLNQEGYLYVSDQGPIRPKAGSNSFEPDRGQRLEQG